MANIKSINEITDKWTRVTPGRAEDFKAGVQKPRADWAASTAAAKDSYAAGVQEAITRDGFSKGVQASGTPKWQAKTLGKGVTRWPAGVREAGPDYSKGFEPYRQTIEATNLPQKFAKGDPRNFDRVVAIGTALHAKKIG